VQWPAVLPLMAFPTVFLVSVAIHGCFPASSPPDLLRSMQVDSLSRTVGWLVLMGLGLALTPGRLADLGLASRPMATEMGLGVATALAAFVPVMTVNLAVAAAGWKEPEVVHPLLAALQSDDGRLWPWVFLSAVVLAPLQEELLYRVLVQGTLEDRWGLGFLTPISISSLLFCSVHFAPGRPDGLALFPLAMLLGYLYWRRHSYVAVVAAHAAFNGINLALSLLGQERGS
jgi:membrane protease YdiL (CAAX protease family)